MLIKCIKRMPKQYRNALVAEVIGTESTEFLFASLDESTVEEFARLSPPWALGLLACAYQILEFGGNRQVQHYAAIALLSVLRSWKNHVAIKEDFEEIWKLVFTYLNNRPAALPGGEIVTIPIAIQKIDEFDNHLSTLALEERTFRREIKEEVDKIIAEIFTNNSNHK